MGKVLEQIKKMPFESETGRGRTTLGVVQRLNELTVKGLAMDPSAVDKIVREALRERWDGEMPLTKSIQKLFDVRQLEMATSSVSLLHLKAMLEKRDHSLIGTDAPGDNIKKLTQHLCNELNSLPMEDIRPFLILVNSTKALGQTTEDWTLAFWKPSFNAYEARTASGDNSVITGLCILHNKNPSLASAVRTSGVVNTDLIHTVASDSLTEELRNNIPEDSFGTVVRCLFEGDAAGARRAILDNRNKSLAGNVFPLGNPDLSGLSLEPM